MKISRPAFKTEILMFLHWCHSFENWNFLPSFICLPDIFVNGRWYSKGRMFDIDKADLYNGSIWWNGCCRMSGSGLYDSNSFRRNFLPRVRYPALFIILLFWIGRMITSCINERNYVSRSIENLVIIRDGRWISWLTFLLGLQNQLIA